MGMFSKILAKLGIGDDEPASGPAPLPRATPTPQPPVGNAMPPKPAGASIVPDAPPPPVEVPVVDVMADLEKRAAANPQQLNWRTSIVDLLKLLDIDSSYAARKELAVELGAPAEVMGDSASMNVWLRKTVLQKIAENGGNVPKELLD